MAQAVDPVACVGEFERLALSFFKALHPRPLILAKAGIQFLASRTLLEPVIGRAQARPVGVDERSK